MQKKVIIIVVYCILLCGCNNNEYTVETIQREERSSIQEENKELLPSHPLVESAREQIGQVTSYDTSYYSGGYPPEDRGACTDVIERALRENGYDLKKKIDEDMRINASRYPHSSDPNINFRRVRNVKIFLDNFAQSLPTCVDSSCFVSSDWQAGDIVTFDQIPGSLWHIAIVSNKTVNVNGEDIPLLIHNYGSGVVEDNKLLTWPAEITGHYRIDIF